MFDNISKESREEIKSVFNKIQYKALTLGEKYSISYNKVMLDSFHNMLHQLSLQHFDDIKNIKGTKFKFVSGTSSNITNIIVYNKCDDNFYVLNTHTSDLNHISDFCDNSAIEIID